VTLQSSEGEETIQVAIPELIGDFSLNAANAITAFELLQSGLDRITAAYDLSANAITELATLLGRKASPSLVISSECMWPKSGDSSKILFLEKKVSIHLVLVCCIASI